MRIRLAALVDEIDGFVGHLTIRDIAVREGGRGDDGGVTDINPVMNLVALFESPENGHRIFDAWLVDRHLLKAPLQRRVFLDVLSKLIQGGRTDTMQLSRAKAGFNMLLASIAPSAFPAPTTVWSSSMNRMILTFLFGQVGENGLQTLLELTPELEPAINAPMSRVSRRRFFSPSGTSPSTMR